ncbi:MAG: NAD(P)-binding domain-containing protein [Alphaproteobacteria bacterium]
MPVAAVIGLGIMGGGAAASLKRAGFTVRGCDVSGPALAKFKDRGGIACTSAAEAAEGADVVFVFVMDASQTELVLFGAGGVVDTAAPGTAVICCATVPPDIASDIGERLAKRGLLPLDAPISGGGKKALMGEVTVIAAGSPEAFEAAGPALDAISAKVFRLGETPGLGTRAKMINQLLGGIHNVATAEAMTLGIASGLDPATLAEVVTASAGSSWMFAQRAPRIAAGDYAAPSLLSIFVKDLAIVTKEAEAAGMSLPLTEVARAQYQAAADAGFGGEDSAALAKVYAERAGVKLPEVD